MNKKHKIIKQVLYFAGKSTRQLKKSQEQVLELLYTMEDNTNYECKPISKCINILQKLDLDKEYKKYNK